MSRMSHPIEQDELMAYLDGELALDRAAMAAAHLEKCRECQSLAGDLQSVSRKMMAWQVEAPDDLRMSQAIGAALEERGRTEQRSATRGSLGWREVLRIPQVPRWLRVGGFATAGLMLLVLFFLSTSHMYSPASVGFYSRSKPASSDKVKTRELQEGSGTIGKLIMSPHEGEAEKEEAVYGLYTGRTSNAPRKASSSATPVAPMAVRTASLTLITKDFDKARAAMEETLKRHGGYMGQLTVSAPSESGRSLTAILRVPSGQLDAAMAELKELGRVGAEAQSGEEVTQQYVDLQARLANAKNSEQRLTDILRNRTGKLSDVLEVEQAIEEVRGNIEQMEAERKNLAKQVDFATLSTTLTEEYESKLQAVPVSTFTRIRNAAVDGYSMVTESLVNLVLFLASYGPVFLLWGAILFFPARAVWRRWRKRSAV